jgi:hypothetical protein
LGFSNLNGLEKIKEVKEMRKLVREALEHGRH